MSKPKITVIGAGSFFFGRPVIWNMTHSPVLREGTLALVDTDPAVLKTMTALAGRAIEATGAGVKLIASVDRNDVLADSDFVVFTFGERNAYFRGLDCRIALRNGIRMCAGDTIGPGGIFRALREVPLALAVARDVARLAPNAWIVNFVNPTSVVGIALMRYAPNVKSFAICDGLHQPGYHVHLCRMAGLLPDEARAIPVEMEQKLDIRTAGVNHFTWMFHFRYEGRDMMPVFRRSLVALAGEELSAAGTETISGETAMDSNDRAKARYNWNYVLQLFDIYKAYPDRIAHTKEYLPFWQGYGTAPCKPAPLEIFDAVERQKKMDRHRRETEDYAYGRRPIGEFLDRGRADHATDIIESMWGGLGKSFYINSANRGAVANMADDAFLELLCHVSMKGPQPLQIGAMPRGLLGWQQLVLDTHELTALAAATCDRDALLAAMATDPIVNNLEDARAIIEESLREQKDILPAGWYG